MTALHATLLSDVVANEQRSALLNLFDAWHRLGEAAPMFVIDALKYQDGVAESVLRAWAGAINMPVHVVETAKGWSVITDNGKISVTYVHEATS